MGIVGETVTDVSQQLLAQHGGLRGRSPVLKSSEEEYVQEYRPTPVGVESCIDGVSAVPWWHVARDEPLLDGLSEQRRRWVEVQVDLFPGLRHIKHSAIDFAVGRLPTHVAVFGGDVAVARVEPLRQVFALTDVANGSGDNQGVDPGHPFWDGDTESTERSLTVLVQSSGVSFYIPPLWAELTNGPDCVPLWSEGFHQCEVVSL
jgi:hypothetical protein